MSRKKAGNKITGEQTNTEREEINDDQEEIVFKETCPYCGKVFSELDADGCTVNDYGKCKDYIGEGDDCDLYFKEGFEIFYEIRDLCDEIENPQEAHALFSHLTGFKPTPDLSIFELMEMFPEVTVSGQTWCGSPGCSGYLSTITVSRKSQAGLLRKLTDIRDRLALLVEAGSAAEAVQTKLKSTKKGGDQR